MELGMRFFRYDTHTIMSGLVIRYAVFPSDDARQISASREGVLVSNLPHLTNIQEVLDVQRVIARAYEQYSLLYSNRGCYAFSSDPPCVVELRKYRVMSKEYEVLETRDYRSFSVFIDGITPPSQP